MLQTCTSINFLTLTVSEIEAEQDFQTQGYCGKVKSRSHCDVAHLDPQQMSLSNFFLMLTHPSMCENNTSTAHKGCGVKMI